MKRMFTLLVIGIMAMSLKGQNSGTNNFARINNNPLNNSSSKPSHMGKFLSSHRPSILHFNSNARYDPDKALAAMQQLTGITYQDYDLASTQWVNNSMDQFTYDVFNRNTSDIYSTWNVSGNMFEQDSKMEFSYDASGHMIEEIYFSWDGTAAQWFPSLKQDYTYNSQGDPTVITSYYWDETANDWTTAGKDEYTYNGNRNVVSEIFYIWNPLTNQWMNSAKTENSYNSNSYIALSTRYSWDLMNNLWVNESKDEYTYDGNDLLTMEVSSLWNTAGNTWVNDYKDEYTYDSEMNMTVDLAYDWSGTAWTISYKDEYQYNNAYTLNDLILPWYWSQNINESGMWMHMPVEYTEYEGAAFTLSSKATFNYTTVNTTGIAEIKAIQANVFPQPATDQVTFSWPSNIQQPLKVELFNSNGKFISIQQVENNGKVSVQNLSAGLYFYRLLENNNTLYSGKLSVR